MTIETPIKVGYTVFWMILSFSSYRPLRTKPTEPAATSSPAPRTESRSSKIIDNLEKIYLLSFIPLQIIYSSSTALINLSLNPDLDGEGSLGPGTGTASAEKYAFAPLMGVSVWCALGFGWCWLRMLWVLGRRGREGVVGL